MFFVLRPFKRVIATGTFEFVKKVEKAFSPKLREEFNKTQK